MTTLRDVIRTITENNSEGARRYKHAHTPCTLVALDYDDSAKVRNRPNYMWVKEYDNPSNAHQVYAPDTQDRPGLPVLVSKAKQAPYFRREVVSVDFDRMEIVEQTGGGQTPTTLSAHGYTHEWPDGNPSGDVFNVYIRSLYPLTIRRVSGMIVYVTPGIYRDGSDYITFGGQLIDLTTQLPASGKTKRVCLYIRQSTNTVQIQSTTEIDSTLEPPFTFPTYTGIPVGWIKLSYDTTSITEVLISDARSVYITGNFPEISSGLKASIEALSGNAGDIAYATDTVEFGVYDGSSWHWMYAGQLNAEDIPVDADTFSGNLSVTDTDVQTALETIDALSFGTSDEYAIHDNVAGEINAVTEKSTVGTDDWLLIEDGDASYVKKKFALDSLAKSADLTGHIDSTTAHDAENIPTNIAGFEGILSGATEVQEALDILDDHAHATLYAPLSHTTLTTTAHGGIREKLSAARTYYVRTDGNDSNDGLSNSSGGAFLTIQAAVNAVAALDINGQIVTIQVADGTYTNGVSLRNVVGYAAAGNLVIQGNSGTPGNVVISTTSANCFDATSLNVAWDIRDLKVQTTTSGYGLYAIFGSTLRFQNIVFGVCANGHIGATYNSIVFCTGNYSIAGGAQFHAYCNGSRIVIQSRTVTFTANVSITYFAYTQLLGIIVISGNTFTEAPYTCTGAEYVVISNSVIFTGGAGAGYLPGTVGGTSSTGGQYV